MRYAHEAGGYSSDPDPPHNRPIILQIVRYRDRYPEHYPLDKQPQAEIINTPCDSISSVGHKISTRTLILQTGATHGRDDNCRLVSGRRQLRPGVEIQSENQSGEVGMIFGREDATRESWGSDPLDLLKVNYSSIIQILILTPTIHEVIPF